MKIHNFLPTLIECLRRWETRPTPAQFEAEYARLLAPVVGDFFEDFHDELLALDWKSYRDNALAINPAAEEQRLRHHLERVESLFGFELEGEICLMGSFHTYDGFARFDRGSHLVYLGIDENHASGKYIDILTVHELTHVARESRPEVWEGFGLNPKMSRAEFLESQPVIEHLMGEGFSCLVSEILVPGEAPWLYCYQTASSWDRICTESAAIERAIKSEIRDPDGDYGRLYRIEPRYAQYVWGWKWAEKVLCELAGGDPRRLVRMSSASLVQHALDFKLSI